MIAIQWVGTEDDGVRAIHDQGDWTGAIITEARVVQGGNGKWTPSLIQFAKSRRRRRGGGRIASKALFCYWPGQVDDREQAIALCESKWASVVFDREEPGDNKNEALMNAWLSARNALTNVATEAAQLGHSAFAREAGAIADTIGERISALKS